MILYAFVCQDGHRFDEFCNVGEKPEKCPYCGILAVARDYMAETKCVRPDWAPGINRSMGIKYSGRRELFEKARGAGFGLFGHGGSIFNYKTKRYYSDEEYAQKTGRLQPIDHQYLELLQNGITSEAKEDISDG